MRQESSSKWRAEKIFHDKSPSLREKWRCLTGICVWGGSVSAVHPNISTICELWWLGPNCCSCDVEACQRPPAHYRHVVQWLRKDHQPPAEWQYSLQCGRNKDLKSHLQRTRCHRSEEEGSSSTVMTANQTWIIYFADFLTFIRKMSQLRHINCIHCLRSDNLLLILPASASDVSLAVFAS